MRRLGPQFAGAVFGTAILVMYLYLTANHAFVLLASGKTAGVAMGIALLFLPLIAGWLVVAEWLFANRLTRLERRLNQANAWPDLDLELRTSGRPTKESADRAFKKFAAIAESNPADWKSWFSLGLAYDAAGDRRRARSAMRKAVALARFEAKTTASQSR
jgi:tetratricopeptide (TPR) repeat protein